MGTQADPDDIGDKIQSWLWLLLEGSFTNIGRNALFYNIIGMKGKGN